MVLFLVNGVQPIMELLSKHGHIVHTRHGQGLFGLLHDNAGIISAFETLQWVYTCTCPIPRTAESSTAQYKLLSQCEMSCEFEDNHCFCLMLR